jgi:UPF0042 nucleotide-binding protein
METIIISGLSGAGKSLAVDTFEDMGYYCIDNLPLSLIRNFIDLIGRDKHKISKVAFVIDIRGEEFFGDITQSLQTLKAEGLDFKLLYLDASDDVLIKRFSETRRQHPIGEDTTTADAIALERKVLEPVRRIADVAIDTTDMNNNALADAIRTFVSGSNPGVFAITIQSFGYKYGMPKDADTVLDMRFIPNPFYVDSLRKLTGNSKKVRDYVMRGPESAYFLAEILELVKKLKPAYKREGKNNLNIAFGCTGGQHRSVAMANMVYAALKETGENVILKHRDI